MSLGSQPQAPTAAASASTVAEKSTPQTGSASRAAGAAGAVLLDAAGREAAASARVLIDLNAVPPVGIHGIMAGDKARADGRQLLYGALGVGGTKMKIHRAAIERIFAQPDAFLDAEELLAIGEATG